MSLRLLCRLMLCCFALATPVANAQKQVVSLGTGGVTGVYYPTGGSLCRLVNAFHLTHGLRCVLEATQGSVSNIKRVLDHTLDLGIAQSNWIFLYYNQPPLNADNGIEHGLNGSASQLSAKPLAAKELRTLLVLYPEYFTVIVPKNSAIYQFDDIKGKRISMGLPGSSLRATMTELLIKKGWHKSDFKQILNLEASEQASALCDGRIDVMIYTVGHPSGAAREATQDCDSRLIAVSGAAIEALLAENSYFRWARIPGALYKGNIKSVETFGVNATLFTSTALSKQAAYSLVKATFEQFNEFRSLHPAFTRLDPEQMVKGPFAAPLHEGAILYFKEIGLM
ncbi:TAXI family TRAP transporter solute-binding subunit [Gammaproteobacteria bacterium AS21]